MPEDLRQQVPYIRRALEVYRIPILGRRALRPMTSSARWRTGPPRTGYSVFVVCSDKDMMQLVE